MVFGQITAPRPFPPFRLAVRLALAWAIIGPGLGARASALEYMYVSMGDNTIVRYDISLGTSALVEASMSVFVGTGQGLDNPRGLAFDTAGNLYAANLNANTITKYDSSGVRVGTNFADLSKGLNTPYGLAFDTAGNLYASNQNANTITKYDSSGARVGTDFVGFGQGLSGPLGLAFDTAGNLYAANVNAKTISKYDSAGVRQLTWSTGNTVPFFLAFVPEPSTYVLGAIATGLMAVIARRRKAAARV
jgi:sugar lactone lactonase YvrE